MNLNTAAQSSWVRSIRYAPVAPGSALPSGAQGFIIVESQTGATYAWACPSWMAGLLAAYIARNGSAGRAFNRLMRAKGFASIKLEREVTIHA